MGIRLVVSAVHMVVVDGEDGDPVPVAHISHPVRGLTPARMFAIHSRLPPLRRLAYLSPSQINTTVQSPSKVFDRDAKRLQKDRAAARDGGTRSRTVDYVRDEVANRLIERFIVSNHSGKLPYDLLRHCPGC
jgi:hypothetical protein